MPLRKSPRFSGAIEGRIALSSHVQPFNLKNNLRLIRRLSGEIRRNPTIEFLTSAVGQLAVGPPALWRRDSGQSLGNQGPSSFVRLCQTIFLKNNKAEDGRWRVQNTADFNDFQSIPITF